MIELTTTLLMLASAFTPSTAQMVADAKSDSTASTKATTTEAISNDHPLTSVSLEAYVRDYFKDAPILAEVAKCESRFRQFNSKGNVLRGEVNDDDIGLMQINTFYHGETAENLGYDIYTIDGNLGFAKYLYSKYGDKPWVHSSPCWKKYREIAQK